VGWQAAGSPSARQSGSGAGHRSNGFFARVYALVAQIPRGKVATYGQIARLLGARRSARIVGWAMHDCPRGSRVPCHRVIQGGGTCSPNFRIGDPGAQRGLLEREGVRFTLDGRVDLASHLWDPDPAQITPPSGIGTRRRARR
jgi:methylated-DNA-protein-cysteine methyltransferase-like protein